MVANRYNFKDFLSYFLDKNVIIIQDGFLKCQFSIEKFTFSIDYEILKVLDSNSNNFLSINLNQVYNFEDSNNTLKFYLDNDTIISLKEWILKDRLKHSLSLIIF